MVRGDARDLEDVRELTSEEYQQQKWDEMSERSFGLRVERIAREHGWLYYHTFNAKHSAGGYPDYHFVQDLERHTEPLQSFYAELKTERGKTTSKQELWARLLIAAGYEYHLWRPHDESDIELRFSGYDELTS